MSTNTTTGTNFIQVVLPNKFRQTSTCPQCGAPIYVDGDLGDELLDKLPIPYFTCQCRFQQAAPTYIPYAPYVPTWPPINPITPTWRVPAVGGGGTGVSPNFYERGQTWCGGGGNASGGVAMGGPGTQSIN